MVDEPITQVGTTAAVILEGREMAHPGTNGARTIRARSYAENSLVAVQAV